VRKVLRQFGWVFSPREYQDHVFQARLQARGKNRQPHHFDEAYILLLDMVAFPVRVEYSIGVSLVAAIVAQNDVDFVLAVPPSADDRDGVVLFLSFPASASSEYSPLFVLVLAPGAKQLLAERFQDGSCRGFSGEELSPASGDVPGMRRRHAGSS
jgi:hypothetical protein